MLIRSALVLVAGILVFAASIANADCPPPQKRLSLDSLANQASDLIGCHVNTSGQVVANDITLFFSGEAVELVQITDRASTLFHVIPHNPGEYSGGSNVDVAGELVRLSNSPSDFLLAIDTRMAAASTPADRVASANLRSTWQRFQNWLFEPESDQLAVPTRIIDTRWGTIVAFASIVAAITGLTSLFLGFYRSRSSRGWRDRSSIHVGLRNPTETLPYHVDLDRAKFRLQLVLFPDSPISPVLSSEMLVAVNKTPCTIENIVIRDHINDNIFSTEILPLEIKNGVELEISLSVEAEAIRDKRNTIQVQVMDFISHRKFLKKFTLVSTLIEDQADHELSTRGGIINHDEQIRIHK